MNFEVASTWGIALRDRFNSWTDWKMPYSHKGIFFNWMSTSQCFSRSFISPLLLNHFDSNHLKWMNDAGRYGRICWNHFWFYTIFIFNLSFAFWNRAGENVTFLYTSNKPILHILRYQLIDSCQFLFFCQGKELKN